jgi:hypothetical protein
MGADAPAVLREGARAAVVSPTARLSLPDRYHGQHGIQAIVRDVGLGNGWPTLTKTNYVEWVAVIRVRLQVRHM